MANRISLSLVIHNHQPVGNFGWVIEDVFERAYGPLLEALHRHSSIRLGLHYSGPLLEWMRRQRPAAIESIRALVERGQVEIVGGGYYEPILVSLPDRDRHGQLVRMADELEGLFGARPRGAWLAERVWEPSLPYDLAEAGYRWTVLDDNHLRCASVSEDEMWSPFTTDDRGRQLTVFGTEQGLRYRIPFKPVADLIEYLRPHATPDGRFVGVMGDDGEKFGAWPGTFDYCWSREHWVERCFEALEANAEWLPTVTPSQWLEGHPPATRVYVPTSSYLEMTEWALPADEAPTFSRLIETARERGLPEARFLRGGFWRNFAARYREIGDLQAQMLAASAAVAAMPDGAARNLALDHLYQGQSNDCYWHGLFGGIYIVHMRLATIGHLIAAQDIANQAALAAGGQPYAARLEDVDLDAVDEALLASPGQTLCVELAEGAGIGRWDLAASRLAMTSVMRRRPEAYHQRLVQHEREKAAAQAKAQAPEAHSGPEAAADPSARQGRDAGVGQDAGGGQDAGAPKTIHDMVSVKEPGLAQHLHYDGYERRSGLAHLLPPAAGEDGAVTPLERFVSGDFEEIGDFLDTPFELVSLADDGLEARREGRLLVGGTGLPLAMTKRLSVAGDRLRPSLELTVTVENRSRQEAAFELALEWSLNMLGGGHNPAAYYEVDDGGTPVRSPHDGMGDLSSTSAIAFGNDYEGVRLTATVAAPARVSWFPIETVSNSEAGFERAYQGSALLFRWPLHIAPGGRASVGVRFAAEQSRDRTAEELAAPPGAASTSAGAASPDGSAAPRDGSAA